MQASKSKALVYVHDDCDVLVRAYVHMLKRYVDVVGFVDVEEAYERVLLAPPDLLITDQRHPGRPGTELIDALRSRTLGRFLRIWMISGTCDPAEAREAGADLGLLKPCVPEEIMEPLKVIGEPLSEFQRLVDHDVESAALDFKLMLDSSKQGIASLSKDVIAMANSGGGQIVFGKRDLDGHGFETVGLTDAQISELEVTRLNRAIANWVDPMHAVQVSPVIPRRGKRLIVVTVPPGREVLFAAKQHEHAKLFTGRVYVRTDAAESVEATRAEQVRAILARLHRLV